MYSTRSRNQASAKRYNTPGTFVTAVQQVPQAPKSPFPSPPQTWSTASTTPTPTVPTPIAPIPTTLTPTANITPIPIQDNITINPLDDSGSEDKKKWNPGKKSFKLSMKEKRRRQNRTLRKLITPKNALMVLNELAAGTQQECTVVPDGEGYGSNQVNRQYVAILNMGGIEYSGKGTTKLLAKNQAAENVIRDMIIKKLNQMPNESVNGSEMDDDSEQSFPMIQLASYAIHKLFTEWQAGGYQIPQLGPGKIDQASITSGSMSNISIKPKKTPALPANPESLHPSTLLSQMRGTLEYVVVSQEGAPPNGQIFTMGVTVDGKMYTGKANNKKEARKRAAMEACKELYGVDYPEDIKSMIV